MSEISSGACCAEKGVDFSELYDAERDYWWSKARRNIIIRFINLLAPPAADPKILDVGCGGGGLLNSMTGYKRLFGLEYYDKGAVRAASNTKADIIRAEAQSMPFKRHSFDVITCLDVIEHLDNDSMALNNFYDLLRGSGIVILTAPAYGFLWSPRDIFLGHKRRYTASRMRLLMKKAGFEIIRCSYLNSFYFPGLLIYSLVERLRVRKRRPKTDIVLLPRVLEYLFSTILKAEAAILLQASLPIGVSVMCIGRKIAKIL